MKTKQFWYLLASAGILAGVLSLLAALITATGAFHADPGERVNRVDFVWAAAGLFIAAYCFYRAQRLHPKK